MEDGGFVLGVSPEPKSHSKENLALLMALPGSPLNRSGMTLVSVMCYSQAPQFSLEDISGSSVHQMVKAYTCGPTWQLGIAGT